MVEIRVSGATTADAEAMIGAMNPFQSRLILALGDKTLQECVDRAFGGSTVMWAGRVDGKLAAIWGVYPLEGGCGYPWMYTTAVIATVPRQALVIARHMIAEMTTLYPRLFGVVDGRYEASVRFAKHLGFTVGSYPAEYPFVTIERWSQ